MDSAAGARDPPAPAQARRTPPAPPPGPQPPSGLSPAEPTPPGAIRQDGSVGRDDVAEADAPRPDDLRVHPKGQRLRCLHLAAVGLEHPQRVEIRDARLRILRRDDAAADVPARPDHGLADADLAIEPAVLGVRLEAV